MSDHDLRRRLERSAARSSRRIARRRAAPSRVTPSEVDGLLSWADPAFTDMAQAIGESFVARLGNNDAMAAAAIEADSNRIHVTLPWEDQGRQWMVALVLMVITATCTLFLGSFLTTIFGLAMLFQLYCIFDPIWCYARGRQYWLYWLDDLPEVSPPHATPIYVGKSIEPVKRLAGHNADGKKKGGRKAGITDDVMMRLVRQCRGARQLARLESRMILGTSSRVERKGNHFWMNLEDTVWGSRKGRKLVRRFVWDHYYYIAQFVCPVRYLWWFRHDMYWR